ncbi:MAG: DUF6428 family protein [Salibacteraceae bacterium]
MKLSEFELALKNLKQPAFVLPNGEPVPPHYHITEVGLVQRFFIDCGGQSRAKTVVNFQLFTAEDYDHRLSATKLLSIINKSRKTIALPDAEIEVEFQGPRTIEKYGLNFDDEKFVLTPLYTDCLAKEKCGIPEQSSIQPEAENIAPTCTPGGGCC